MALRSADGVDLRRSGSPRTQGLEVGMFGGDDHLDSSGGRRGRGPDRDSVCGTPRGGVHADSLYAVPPAALLVRLYRRDGPPGDARQLSWTGAALDRDSRPGVMVESAWFLFHRLGYDRYLRGGARSHGFGRR